MILVSLLPYRLTSWNFYKRHVHLDDPGRSEWEGFSSGTKAAAAGNHICFSYWDCSSCKSVLFCAYLLYSASWDRLCLSGGITTLVDMPLNSFPSTVSPETLKLKVKQIHFSFPQFSCLSKMKQCVRFCRLKLRKTEYMLMLVNTLCYQILPRMLSKCETFVD